MKTENAPLTLSKRNVLLARRNTFVLMFRGSLEPIWNEGKKIKIKSLISYTRYVHKTPIVHHVSHQFLTCGIKCLHTRVTCTSWGRSWYFCRTVERASLKFLLDFAMIPIVLPANAMSSLHKNKPVNISEHQGCYRELKLEPLKNKLLEIK